MSTPSSAGETHGGPFSDSVVRYYRLGTYKEKRFFVSALPDFEGTLGYKIGLEAENQALDMDSSQQIRESSGSQRSDLHKNTPKSALGL